MAKLEIGKGFNVRDLILVLLTVAIGILAGSAITVSIAPKDDGVVVEAKTTLELAQENVEATIVDETGTEEVADVPTVIAVDSNQSIEECPEGEECGKGWYVETSTPQAFVDAVYGQCIDTDGHYGSQCWDAGNLFWQNYAGRTLSTCGTGAAKGILNCYEHNAGSEFEMIWDATQLQPGDWVIFTNGQYGHIGMALGYYNNGYISLFGTNQGGASCSGGGSTANIINISLANFGGAFRPKTYIAPEPEPEPEPVVPITGCLEWAVSRGDTMSKIMYECEGFLAYGDAMDVYAKSWFSRIVKPGQSVYDGWHSASGVGLYYGDWIDHIVD